MAKLELDENGYPELDEDGVKKAIKAFCDLPDDDPTSLDMTPEIRAALKAYNNHMVDKLVAEIKAGPREPDQQDLDYQALDKMLLDCLDAMRRYLDPQGPINPLAFSNTIIGILDNQTVAPIIKRNEERMRRGTDGRD